MVLPQAGAGGTGDCDWAGGRRLGGRTSRDLVIRLLAVRLHKLPVAAQQLQKVLLHEVGNDGGALELCWAPERLVGHLQVVTHSLSTAIHLLPTASQQLEKLTDRASCSQMIIGWPKHQASTKPEGVEARPSPHLARGRGGGRGGGADEEALPQHAVMQGNENASSKASQTFVSCACTLHLNKETDNQLISPRHGHTQKTKADGHSSAVSHFSHWNISHAALPSDKAAEK